MKPFEYAAPATVEDATALLAAEWGETEVLAGGMDLLSALKDRVVAPSRVVSLKNITALKGIEADSSEVRIGATTSLAAVASHDAVRQHFPSMVQAIKSIGSRQMIAMGTLGGDLCQRPRCWYFRNGEGLLALKDGASLVEKGDNRYHAIFGNDGPAKYVHPSSLAPALAALGAAIEIAGPGGTREVEASSFFRTPAAESDRETVLKANEIVTGVRIPIAGLKNATYEVRHRHGLDWPIVTATVAYKDDGGRVSDARVVLGHVAPVPWASAAAANALNGSAVTADSAAKAGDAAAQGATPLSQNAYKVRLVKTAVKRAALGASGVSMEA